jgi:hypothetical protein
VPCRLPDSIIIQPFEPRTLVLLASGARWLWLSSALLNFKHDLYDPPFTVGPILKRPCTPTTTSAGDLRSNHEFFHPFGTSSTCGFSFSLASTSLLRLIVVIAAALGISLISFITLRAPGQVQDKFSDICVPTTSRSLPLCARQA